MEGADQHSGFFRFRSPGVAATGDPKRPWFVADHFRLIDISRRLLIREALAVCQVFPGAFSQGDLADLFWDDYEFVVEQTREIRDAAGS